MVHEQLTARQMVSYCAYAVPLTAVAAAVNSMIPPLYSESFGVPLALVGLILFSLRITDALTDPAMGWAVDQHWFRKQHRPWILIAYPVFFLSTLLLFVPIGSMVSGTYLFVTGFFLYIAYTIGIVTHQSWGAAIAKGPEAVSALFGYREVAVIVGILGTFVFSAVAEHLYGDSFNNKATAAAIFILSMLTISTLITFLFTPDRDRETGVTKLSLRQQAVVLKDRNFLLLCIGNMLLNFAWVTYSVLSFFVATRFFDMGGRFALGLVSYFVVAGIAMWFWMKLASTMGTRRALVLAGIYTAAAFCSLLLWPQISGPFAYFGYVMLLGSSFGAGPYLIRALIGQIANELEDSLGGNVRGIAFAIATFFDKFGTGLAAGLILPAVTFFGFDPRAGSTGAGSTALLLITSLVPAFAFLLVSLFVGLIRSDRRRLAPA